MDEYEIMEKAEKKVKAKKGFYWHLAVFMAVGFFFFAMNMATSPGDIWFFFPLLPWSIGLILHGVGVFGLPFLNVLTDEWEKEQFQKEVYELKEKHRSKNGMLMLEEEDDHLIDINERDYEGMRRMKKEQARRRDW